MKKKRILLASLLIASTLLASCAPQTAVDTSSDPSSEIEASSEPESSAPVSSAPVDENPPFPSASDTLEYAKKVGQVTGRKGYTDTKALFDVYGTDLGIPYYDEELGRLTFFFGDTFAEAGFTGDWRSNVAMFTTQTDYSEGITLTGALTKAGAAESGAAVQIGPGRNFGTPLLDGSWTKTLQTHTCIPTGAVMVGSTTYLFYMEIDKNGFPETGGWGVYSNRVLKSEDHGETWQQVPDMSWLSQESLGVDGTAPNFGQIYPLKVDDYVYLYGLRGGRSGGTKVARVLAEQIEDLEAYEYFTGFDDEGNAGWKQGSEGLAYIKERDEAYAIEAPCGEMCVTYNAYLGKYLALYQLNDMIVYRTSDTPYGPFSDPEPILKAYGDGRDMRNAYGAFTCEQMSDMGGQRIWIMVSEWDPVYNVSQVEIMFK